ncbi:MgtC/SapB family protein [Streptomyces nanshensis]|uniref:Magnesium transporter MgtC n=1 Tax=Streptomyces nanshensis TaxID=518642 RepID=A0A1E7L042_9ACTN|nr:MgtC/SapB family protein [Streptomyces nanshensis]OEV09501.1 magnesium transporter MgtC [Streptomyces nanshensis]
MELAAPLWDVHNHQGWAQLGELGLALVLSTLIGWERGAQQKSAGLRTHAIVGVASALMMQISQYGFSNVLGTQDISFDPSRVAAQIVTGIGFIGGGLIFVRKDAVRGLTTAATVWLTCAVGMACGGGLGVLAAVTTALHFVIVRGYPLLASRLSVGPPATESTVRLRYRTGAALLPQLMEMCTSRGFRILAVRVDRVPQPGEAAEEAAGEGREREDDTARVLLRIEGTGDVRRLATEIFRTPGVLGMDVAHDPGPEE